MPEGTNVSQTTCPQQQDNVRPRQPTLRGGHDPAESGRLSGQKRRERRAARERDAELDALTVLARHSTVRAEKLTAGAMREAYDALLDLVRNGTGHVRRQAAADLIKLASASELSGDDDDVDPAGLSFSEMTPAQRAAARAVVEREIQAAVRELEEGCPGGSLPTGPCDSTVSSDARPLLPERG
jgi:hypothetical protein